MKAAQISKLGGDWELVAGWYSGTAKDSPDTMEFSALSHVHPMIEKYPLDRVAEACERMHSGKVPFRVVLTFGA